MFKVKKRPLLCRDQTRFIVIVGDWVASLVKWWRKASQSRLTLDCTLNEKKHPALPRWIKKNIPGREGQKGQRPWAGNMLLVVEEQQNGQLCLECSEWEHQWSKVWCSGVNKSEKFGLNSHWLFELLIHTWVYKERDKWAFVELGADGSNHIISRSWDSLNKWTARNHRKNWGSLWKW